MSYSPIIFCGLGKVGSDIAKKSYEKLKSDNENLSAIIRCFTLNESGSLENLWQDIDISIENLTNNYSVDSVGENFSSLENEEESLSNILQEILSVAPEIIGNLQGAGIDLDDTRKIFLFFSLSDPVGSVAYFEIIKIIQNLLENILLGIELNINIIGLFPDLSGIDLEDAKIREFAYNRTVACIKEIEELNKESEQLIYPYLFTKRNEKGDPIGSYKGLIETLGEYFSNVFKNKMNLSASINRILASKDVDCRYMSFGFSKIIFPVYIIMEKIYGHFICKILKHINIDNPPKDNANVLTSKINSFLSNERFDKIDKDAFLNKNDGMIWEPPDYHIKPYRDTPFDGFIETIEKDTKKYKDDNWAELIRKVNSNNTRVVEDKFNSIKGYIEKKLRDDPEKLFHCKNILDILIKKKAAYVDGDVIGEETNSIKIMEEKTKNFFDKQIEPKREELKKLEIQIENEENQLEDLSERIKDLDKGDPYYKRLENDITKITKKLKTLRDPAQKLRDQIYKYDNEIENAGVRNELLSEIITNIEDTKRDKVKEAKSTSDSYHKKKSEYKKILRQRKKIFKQSYIVAGLGFVVSLILLLIFRERINISYFQCFISSLSGLICGYGIWFYLKYWRRLKIKIENIRGNRNNLAERKEGFLRSILNLTTTIYRTKFEHILFGNLLEKVIKIGKSIHEYRDLLGDFIKILDRKLNDNQGILEEDTFPHKIYIRNEVSIKNIEGFIEQKQKRFERETEKFFQFEKNPKLLYFFNEFKEKNNLQDLEDNVKKSVDDMFSELKNKSLENYLLDKYEDNKKQILARMTSQYTKTKSFIQIVLAEAIDKSKTLVFCGINDFRSSQITDEFIQTISANIQFIDNENKHEIYFMKLKVGFLPDYISMFKYATNTFFNRLSDTDKEKYMLVNPRNISKEFETTENDAGMNISKVYTLGYALNFIEKSKGKFYYNGNLIGKNKNEVMNYLVNNKNGKNILVELTDKIEIELDKDEIFGKLTASYQTHEFDEKDKEIINNLINS